MKIFNLLKKTIIILLSILVFLSIIGFIYESIARKKVLKNYPPPGKMVNVGDHNLHALIKGEGGPTVVFESGLGTDGHLSWYKIQDSIAKTATTVTYDRAGLVYSERGKDPKTCKNIAEELHDLLTNSGLAGPYILVGHSLGGLLILSFVEQYPEDVQGVIFVDAAHPEMFERTRVYHEMIPIQPPYWLHSFASKVGVVRLLTRNSVQITGNSTTDECNILINKLFPPSYPGYLQEFKQLDNLCNEVRDIKSFGNIPVISLYAAMNKNSVKTQFPGIRDEVIDKFIETVMDVRKSYSGLSSNGRSMMIENTGHYIHHDRPEVVINAIQEIIRDIEKGSENINNIPTIKEQNK